MARQGKSGAGQGDSKTIHVLNGPNLNLLGEREPEIYGTDTLADAERLCLEAAKAGGLSLNFSQTNSEGELIDQIQAARASAGIVINPAGCSYSVPVLDALEGMHRAGRGSAHQQHSRARRILAGGDAHHGGCRGRNLRPGNPRLSLRGRGDLPSPGREILEALGRQPTRSGDLTQRTSTL